jgi:hypothetical protein
MARPAIRLALTWSPHRVTLVAVVDLFGNQTSPPALAWYPPLPAAPVLPDEPPPPPLPAWLRLPVESPITDQDLPACLTSLDPVETSAQEPTTAGGACPQDLADVGFRHSGWMQRRRIVASALADAQTPPARQQRFATCGTCARVFYSPSQQRLQVRSNHCRDRFCVPCATARSLRAKAVILARARNERCRLFTFTLRHSDTPLRDQLERLYESFARLRRRDAWKSHVAGGVAVLELKLSRTDNLWHPHLHVLATGDYWPQQDLRDHWHAVTGDSYIVDVRDVPTAEAVQYVGKYASKPLDPSTFRSRPHLVEAIRALAGRRLFATFGSWHNLALDDQDLHEDPADWQFVATLAHVRAWARAGHDAARHLLNLLVHNALCDVPQDLPDQELPP